MKAAATIFSFILVAPCAGVWAQCEGAEYQLLAASGALSNEDVPKAGQILDSLERSNPRCPELVLDRGRISYLQGDTSNAESALAHFIQLAPDDARGYAHVARVFLDEHQYARADAASLLALQKNSIDPDALAVRGQILGMKGYAAQGIALLERACQFGPDNADAHYQLGVLYAGDKRRGDAAKEFKRSLAIVPANARAWDYLALSLEPLGDVDGAEEVYRKGEAVNTPGRHFDGFLDYNYGRFLAKRNQLKEAEQHLDRAVELAPDVRAVWYERANTRLSLGNYADARADAEKAASLPDPRGVVLDLQIYSLLEKIYRRLGDKQSADKYADLSRGTPTVVQQPQQR